MAPFFEGPRFLYLKDLYYTREGLVATMNRITRLAAAIIVVVLSSTASAAKPNVLFNVMDDLNDWTGCMRGHPQARTPNLDRLAASGVLFTNAHCPAPSCNPSRTAILTGISPHTSGLLTNRQKMRDLLPDAELLPRSFSRHGYWSAGAGKLLHYVIDAPSWDDYFPAKGSENPLPFTLYPEQRPVSLPVGGPWQYIETDWAPLDATDEEFGGDGLVSKWVGEQLSREHDQPFFLACGIYRPHEPWFLPRKYFEHFPLDGIQLPPGYREHDLKDVPSAGQKLGRNRYFDHIRKHDQWKQAIQGYLASIAFADAMLGRVLQALDEGPSLVPLLRDPQAAWEHVSVTYLDKPGTYAVSTEDWRLIHYANGDEELYHTAEDPHEWTNLASASQHQDHLVSLRVHGETGLGAATKPSPVTASVPPNNGSKPPPNIVVFLADDLGIECLSAYGGRSHVTPNIDSLARDGMRFTHCFSNPYCSPSRATLLTGRYPFRNGLKEVIFDAKRHADTFLCTDQPSFARQLRKAGYATAIAGKWQLSFLRNHDTIHDFGFDEYQCWQIIAPDGSRTSRFAQPYFRQNGVVIADAIRDRYGPDVNVEFLTSFITKNAHEKRPFLAYYTCLLPHFPWEPTPDSIDQGDKPSAAGVKGDKKYFPDMVKYLDKQVGQILAGIDDAGIADNTIVMFLADNGTDSSLQHRYENDVLIQGGKGTMTDRGTRVPLIVRWPGHVKAGTRCDDLVDFSDVFPTLCELSGAPLPDAKLDGQSFAPQALGQAGTPRAWVHFQDKEERVVRDHEFMLTNRGELRRVVEIWEEPSVKAISNDTPEERAARERLQKAFDDLGS